MRGRLPQNGSCGVIIPARYQSTRFPGKPLADILGNPMIHHVWTRCCKAVGAEYVYVATDDDQIDKCVKNFGGNVIRTSSACLTGTDRVAEANKYLGFEFVVNVQGDEPLISPSDILKVADTFCNGTGEVVNAMTKIVSDDDFYSLNVPKVVVDDNNKLLYMSRSPIPISKRGSLETAYKQVCIYAFSREHLHFVRSRREKSKLESIEDIEILSFIESGIGVRMVEVLNNTIAVDTPEDLDKVKEVLRTNKG